MYRSITTGSVRCSRRYSSSSPTVLVKSCRTPSASHDPGRPASTPSIDPMFAAAPARARVTNSAQSAGSRRPLSPRPAGRRPGWRRRPGRVRAGSAAPPRSTPAPHRPSPRHSAARSCRPLAATRRSPAFGGHRCSPHGAVGPCWWIRGGGRSCPHRGTRYRGRGGSPSTRDAGTRPPTGAEHVPGTGWKAPRGLTVRSAVVPEGDPAAAGDRPRASPAPRPAEVTRGPNGACPCSACVGWPRAGR